MTIIIHSTDPALPLAGPAAQALATGAPLVILAAPRGAAFPPEAGAPDGPLLRLCHAAPEPSAMHVLARCALILRRIHAAAGQPLDYRRAGAAGAAADPGADLAWTLGPQGEVTAFRLSAGAAGDPLLAPMAEELADQPLAEARRFAFLSAILTGG